MEQRHKMEIKALKEEHLKEIKDIHNKFDSSTNTFERTTTMLAKLTMGYYNRHPEQIKELEKRD